MPYTKMVTTQSGDALSLEMKGVVETAVLNSGKYTRVTTNYVSGTKTFNVYQNDGTTDGYQWYLVVQTDTANTGRVLLGGCLEYSDATKIAKKALRGYSTVGFVDPTGYPLVSAGGAEMTFALGSFTPTSSNTTGVVGAAGTQPTAAVTGNTFRVLVTGQVVWIWWGTATTGTTCHGVGTYQNLHSTTQDLKPLAFLAHNSSSNGGGTVWQNPAATAGSVSRNTFCAALSPSATSGLGVEAYSVLIGQVGVSGTDMNYDSNVYIGSRQHVVRETGGVGQGGGNGVATVGWSLGLAPSDFLLFGKQASTAVGDTVTVGGKLFENVTSAGVGCGLFINTQPAV